MLRFFIIIMMIFYCFSPRFETQRQTPATRPPRCSHRCGWGPSLVVPGGQRDRSPHPGLPPTPQFTHLLAEHKPSASGRACPPRSGGSRLRRSKGERRGWVWGVSGSAPPWDRDPRVAASAPLCTPPRCHQTAGSDTMGQGQSFPIAEPPQPQFIYIIWPSRVPAGPSAVWGRGERHRAKISEKGSNRNSGLGKSPRSI